MKQKIREAIQELASISFAAEAIASRLGIHSRPADSIDTVTELKEEITKLKSSISSLELLLAQPEEEEISEVEEREFIQVFSIGLEGLPPASMKAYYDEHYLDQYPENIQKLICAALVNACLKKNITPLPVWADTANS